MTNRVLLDSSGLKCSLPSYDVLTSTNSSTLSFSSIEGQMGVYLTGSTGAIANGTTYQYTYPAAFSYIPRVHIQEIISTSQASYGFSILGGGSGTMPLLLTFSESALYIYNGTGATKSFKYFIFHNQG